ncbi:MAG: hypothetical protein WC538_21260 [Thermoanaerobaculia bacterium]|jgi:hypothetical protein
MRRLLGVATLVALLTGPSAIAGNLLQNAEFDHDLSGWVVDPVVAGSWQALDSANERASGSGTVVNSVAGGYEGGLQQCVAVVGGQSYETSARVLIPSGQTLGSSQAGLRVLGWYASSGCSGTSLGYGVGQGITKQGEWTQIIDYVAAPAAAHSALIVFSVGTQPGFAPIHASFDHLFFGAATPDTPGALETLYVPAVASLHGGNDAFFHSDVWITNLSYQTSTTVTLVYRCYASQTCNSSPKTVILRQRGTAILRDIAGTTFASPETGGAMEVTHDAYVPIAIASRLYTPASQPTYGFSLGARSIRDASTRAAFSGIAGGGPTSSGYRSNVGAYNPNDAPANLTITLYDATGNQLGSPVSQSVPGHTPVQVNGIFAAAGVSSASLMTDASAVVTSDVPVFSFASTLDNVSNDSSFLDPVRDWAAQR